jgi:hypothetical protein
MKVFIPCAAVAAACAFALLAAGCGSDDQSAETRTVVTVVRSEAAPATPDSSPTNSSADGSDSASGSATSGKSSDGSSASGKIRVPDVAGKDHQLAQDTMQAAGLYNVAEEDATGLGRMLLLDRNWTVVSQSPSAGTMVAADRTITLRSKKDGE